MSTPSENASRLSTLEGMSPENIEQLVTIEQPEIVKIIEHREWESLTETNFPATAYRYPKEIYLPRLAMILEEIQAIAPLAQIVAIDARAINTLQAKLHSYRQTAAETVLKLYGEAEPIEDGLEPIRFTRDDSAALEFAFGSGLVQLLSPDFIPALKFLKPSQLLNYKLKLLEKFAEDWREHQDDNLANSLGFTLPLPNGESENLLPSVDEAAKIVLQQIATTMNALARQALPDITTDTDPFGLLPPNPKNK